MKLIQASNRSAVLRGMAIALTSLAVIAAAPGDLIVTNTAGVRAGITGIVYRGSDNSVAVVYFIGDPTGTNVTMFTIQSSPDLKIWTDYSPTFTVTGSLSSAETSDSAAPQIKFYRMRLINFQ
jgi:hypothetical protein